MGCGRWVGTLKRPFSPTFNIGSQQALPDSRTGIGSWQGSKIGTNPESGDVAGLKSRHDPMLLGEPFWLSKLFTRRLKGGIEKQGGAVTAR